MELKPDPIAVIDFEACSLGSGSYPIEVGVALVPNTDQPLHVWSTLIQPHSSWSSTAWDARAERIHGIPQLALSEGLSPSATLLKLNELLKPIGTALCDGGDFDRFWFERLCRAAPLIKPEFQLGHISELLIGDEQMRARLDDALALTRPPHRAGPDAARLCQALCDAGAGSRVLVAAPGS